MFGAMYATRSPFFTSRPCSAEDQRSHRSKNCSYVRRRSPSTTASRSPYSFLARRANSSGVSGVSMPVLLSRIQHQREIGALDPAYERAVGPGLQLNRALVDERIDVVKRPVAITLDAQAVAQGIVLAASGQKVPWRERRWPSESRAASTARRWSWHLPRPRPAARPGFRGRRSPSGSRPPCPLDESSGRGSIRGYPTRWFAATEAAIRMAMMLMTLIIGLIAGPAVSLFGSPTVSPVTDALCASDPLPPRLPSSMYFLALSQAAPPLVI